MIKAVIFDMDGVIADSHNIINNLFTELLNKHLNLNLDVKEFAKYPGMRFEHRTEILTKEKGIHLSKEEIDEIMEIGREEYYNNKIDYTRIYPGMKELLEELNKSNIKLALGTNGSRRTIAKLIEQFNIKNYFDAIVTYDDVARGKPFPDIFLKDAELLNVSPKECVVIEDSIEGIEAAKEAGMKVIAVSTTMKIDELKKADMIIKTIKELNVKKIQQLQ